MPRYVRRRAAPKRKSGMRKRRMVRRKAGSKKGYLVVKRKLPELYIRNTNVAGVAATTDPTVSCLNIGAPIAEPVGGTYAIPFSMVFRMDQLINSTDITNLCDAYKLKNFKIGCTYLSSQASVGGTALMPQITWVQDHDDAQVPGSINALREKQGVKLRTFGYNKIINISVQPRVADAVYNNGVTTAYSVPKQMWLNSQYPGAEHYAIKGILNNVNLTATATVATAFKFDVTATVHGKDFQ